MSLAAKLAVACDLPKLRSLVAAGVPAWKMLLARSEWMDPLSAALQHCPADKVADASTFFLDGAAELVAAPHLHTAEEADAMGKLREVLSSALYWACRLNREPAAVRLLGEFADRADPTWGESGCLYEAAAHGYTSIVALLLADGRADPAANNGEALGWALCQGHAGVVAALKADPRCGPWAHLTEDSPEVRDSW